MEYMEFNEFWRFRASGALVKGFLGELFGVLL